PFRDAYVQVGQAIAEGKFEYSTKVNHTHEGSIGNLNNDQIQRMMQEAIAKFNFDSANKALKNLLVN
ncbi:MAG: argininosuccinate lyase, partial [Cyclobacteriaceae bacterium]|nr:argininosuccinate lyase [Cyclobacteriaceae bacterium]